MHRYRLLYFEGEETLRSRVSAYLENYAFDVTPVASSADVDILLHQHQFDVVLLDMPTPGGEPGLLLEALARRGTPPVVVTSAHAEEADRILAIETGADDFLEKPFNPRELAARLRAVARRRSADTVVTTRRVARFDNWTFDPQTRRATDGQNAVELTGGETELLGALLDHPRRLMTRVDLLTATRHDEGAVFDRTVDVLISRLRRKLETDPLHPRLIQTVRGGGYYFDCDVQWDDSDAGARHQHLRTDDEQTTNGSSTPANETFH